MNIEDALRKFLRQITHPPVVSRIRTWVNNENRMCLTLNYADGSSLDFVAVEDKLIPHNQPQVVGAQGFDTFASMEKRQ